MSASVLERIALLAKRFNAIEQQVQHLQSLYQINPNTHHNVNSKHVHSLTTAEHVANNQRKNGINGIPQNLWPCKEDTLAVAALREWCISHKLFSATFKWVPHDYYSHSLQWRRDILNAPTIQHLCKTIVLQNTHCTRQDCSERNNSRYYMIVYQYVTRFDADMVMKVIRQLNPGLGKKKFNFRLADPSRALQLTGFPNGAVAPLGTPVSIPVVLSAQLMHLTPFIFWVGGGDIACKCRVHTQEYINVMNPIIAPITVPLSPEEMQNVAD